MSEEGGDDSPPRPKRKIKKVVVLSSTSESDSDDSVGVAGTRRKRLRVISDEDGNNSSGSSVVCPGTRRRRTLPKLRDSDAESDSSGWATDHSQPKKVNVSTAKTNSGFASDSSEGNSDKCSICLLRFTIQEVGTPENCEHIFCLDCITEWSRNVNTCPVDRLTFNSIVVKTCAGGRVLRTEPVKVEQRRSSVEVLVVEDTTPCEICGSIENEESMLLCDGCDLGFHMQCLNPPLTQVPEDQWLCPNCDVDIDNDEELLDVINFSEVEDLFDGIVELDLPVGPRSVPLRQPRNVRRSSRNVGNNEQPSTSSSNRSNNVNELPTTSRGTRSTQRSTPHINRRRTTTRRRKYKRRRTKTVIIEYEVQENGKFPITKKITRRVKKRRVKKRRPRTVARRSYVRASVQAKLASERSLRQNLAQASNATLGVKNLSLRRQRAGIPSLSLMGNPNELDYFTDEDNAVSEAASTAVAVRPTSNILSAYRQARRKIVSIPSPTHASSAPDVLSNILESQTLLHSKNSLVSITVDGNINIKLQTQKHSQQKKNIPESKKDDKIDLANAKANESVKCVPSYPGQGRGGGWGGGYRGGYQRDQHQNNNGFNRGGGHNYDGYGGGYQSRSGGHGSYQQGMRRDDPDYYDSFPRRPPFTNSDESYFDRSRRPSLDNGRGGTYGNHQRVDGGRYSAGPAWPSSGPAAAFPAGNQPGPPPHSRHSFGGFENPVDMRMGQMSQSNLNSDMFSGVAPRQEKPQPQVYQTHPEPQTYRPSPEPQPFLPPSQPQPFDFQKVSEIEKSEDEKSDPGLVIDTEKYDPTEPTHDDDSGDEDKVVASLPQAIPSPPSAPVPPPMPVPTLPLHVPEAPPAQCVQNILAGIDTSAMNVPPNILDTAVRQVLQEHRNLIISPRMKTQRDRSDDDSDGDCPNFSIYSATSVHIANYTSILPDDLPQEQPQEGMEDLVQEDDDTPPSTSPVAMPEAEEKKVDITRNQFNKFHYSISESIEKKKSEEEYKEKVSKRCPITTNTRHPIKIKLHTPSLIKRQVSLYDDEEMSQDAVVDEKLEPSEISESRNSIKNSSTKKEVVDSSMSKNKQLSPSNDNVKFTEKVQEVNINNIHNSRSVEENISALLEEDNKVSGNDSAVDINDYKVSNETKISVIKTEAENKVKNDDESIKASDEKSDSEINSDNKIDNLSDKELSLHSQKNQHEHKEDENVEKMTESISETEDERSYTPCLDENKSNKDASFDNERDKGLEGLDTEMISEEEGNDMFSENERPPSHTSRASPVRARSDDVELPDKKRDVKKISSREDNTKKKKKKDSKKESKDKSKSKKKTEVTFKKLSKSGKERNYRERDRDKDEKKVPRERRDSGDVEARRRRKEKRKDLERYDVRSLVTEKRRKLTKDAFGRDVSPRDRSPSLSPAERSPSPNAPRRDSSTRRTPSRAQRSPSPLANRALRSLSRTRRSPSRTRRSHSRVRRSPSKSRRSHSRPRRSFSRSLQSASRLKGSPSRMKRSVSRGRRSPTPPRRTPSRARRSPIIRKSPTRRGSVVRGRTASRGRPSPVRGRPSPARVRRSAPRRSATPRASSRRRSPPRRKRRRSASRLARRRSASASPPRRALKKKKRARSSRRAPAASPERKRRRSTSANARSSPALVPPSPVSRPPSPRTPPPEPVVSPLALLAEEAPERPERRRRDPERPRRRLRDAPGPSKEVFTSGDNILVSVSFKEQERSEEGERRRRRETRRERRRRRRTAVAPELEVVKPVAIIDLERSPFRELTPSPKNVIVLSDSDQGEREATEQGAQDGEAADEPPAPGPKTPPEPEAPEPTADAAPERERTPPAAEPHSPDAYDPFEPTRSASASPSGPSAGSPASPPSRASPDPAPATSPPRTLITLEAAQRSNLSADEVLDRRPLSPVEKVLALLQSTRDASPEPPPGAPEPSPVPRIVLPSPTRVPAKLFPGKPSPIKSNPVKPMQATRLPRPPPPPLASDGGTSPYSPGSSDFGELFEPPTRRSRVPGRLDRKKGKTQVGVRIDDDNLKILDDLPSSAVEMQVKSKFLKKLNRQERVVEEVKLVLKPHYNKKRVTKDEYKDILRRAVPKICHNKSGEINPTKIQALVEAYVKKFRKKHKLGVA